MEMATTAKLSFTRISPQKMRLVSDQVRGLPVEKALEILKFSNKKAAAVIKKVLDSAIANAEHNEGVDIDDLTLSAIVVDAGATMKRMRPRARGRADRIIKRTSHLRVTISGTKE